MDIEVKQIDSDTITITLTKERAFQLWLTLTVLEENGLQSTPAVKQGSIPFGPHPQEMGVLLRTLGSVVD